MSGERTDLNPVGSRPPSKVYELCARRLIGLLGGCPGKGEAEAGRAVRAVFP